MYRACVVYSKRQKYFKCCSPTMNKQPAQISYSVTPNCGKHHWVSLLTVPVKLDSKQRLTMILL